jgi:F0F1-type ATP synthase delta subunit
VNYMEAYRRRLGTVSAKVSSAVALSSAQRAQIEAAILASGAKISRIAADA